MGFSDPFGVSFIPHVSVFGEYINNPDPSTNNQGYLSGLLFGQQSIKKFGDWNIEYTFRRLEKDAWLDVSPFSDFYGGATNVMGHMAKLSLGLTKNVSFGPNYINAWFVCGAPGGAANRLPKTQNLVQADLMLKFQHAQLSSSSLPLFEARCVPGLDLCITPRQGPLASAHSRRRMDRSSILHNYLAPLSSFL